MSRFVLRRSNVTRPLVPANRDRVPQSHISRFRLWAALRDRLLPRRWSHRDVTQQPTILEHSALDDTLLRLRSGCRSEPPHPALKLKGGGGERANAYRGVKDTEFVPAHFEELSFFYICDGCMCSPQHAAMHAVCVTIE